MTSLAGGRQTERDRQISLGRENQSFDTITKKAFFQLATLLNSGGRGIQSRAFEEVLAWFIWQKVILQLC